ncbi:MAG: SusC/RagA family TonB-linked outer membrane protein [Citrobacter freundii]|nr:MAG: SusC/RagA family TonB-linked outer membrane protein [Citrobacter freundii]
MMKLELLASGETTIRPKSRRRLPGISFLAGTSVKNALRIMKITAVLLLAFIMQATARGYAQGITLSEKNASLETVFKKITKQTGYIFWYENKLIRDAKKVSIETKNATLDAVMRSCLDDQQLEYSTVGNTIVIRRKKESADNNQPIPAIDLRGTVTDVNGQPIASVTVSVKNSNKGVNTNEAGQYLLRDVKETDVLVFSSVGYTTQEVAVNGRAVIDIQLAIAISSLDEAVVIAYGKTSRRLNTGSVASVTSKEIESQPVADPLAALQGRVAGLNITATNGLPGSSLQVRLRGENSLNNGSDPLYIIDGVPFISTPLNQFNGANGQQSPLASINPNDIERIDVLKDADATAIYGSRGANGVILITTRKGKTGKAVTDFNIYSGVSTVSRKIDMLSTSEYLAMRKEAFALDGQTPTATNAPDLLIWDQQTQHDWQDMLVGQSAHVTQVQGSISGGNETTRFLLSGTYRNEGTVLPSDLGYKRGSVHFSLDHSSKDGRFNITSSINYSADKNNIIATDITQYYKLAPNMPVYNDDGSYYWFSTVSNPLAYLHSSFETKTNNLVANAVLRYTILPGLNIRTNLGYTKTDFTQTSTLPKVTFNPDNYAGSMARYGFSDVSSYIVEPQADYSLKFGANNLQLLAGASWQQNLSEGHSLSGSGYSSDALLKNMKDASALAVDNYNYAKYRYQSVFGRATYNWDQKYLLNATFRRDGSSRFGPDKRFGNFGSIGAGWIFSSEDFVTRALPFLSFGKLRASYGTTGNDQIGDYAYLDSWSSVNFPYGGGNGLYPTRLANGEYGWETNRKMEAAIELGFLKNAILFNVNYYNNRSGNQLIQYSLSSQSGFDSYIANLPAKVQNQGWEFELNTTNIKSKHFSWTTSANLSIISNKLLEYPDLEESVDASRYVIGQSIRIIKGYQFTGVNSQTGIAQFADIDKDGAITESGDFVILGNTMPKFFGGLQNIFTYKKWQLDFLFQFVKQDGPTIDYGAQASVYGTLANQTKKLEDRWRQPGDVTSIPRPSATASNAAYLSLNDQYRYSSAVWGDASFIRLKNISLRYDLSSLTRRWKIDNSSIYFQAQNLLTITHYDGFDPETKGFDRTNISEVLPFGTIRPAVVPTLSTFTLGLRFSL